MSEYAAELPFPTTDGSEYALGAGVCGLESGDSLEPMEYAGGCFSFIFVTLYAAAGKIQNN